MTKQIEILDASTGVIKTVNLDATLLDIVGEPHMTLNDAADKIADQIKGVSSAKALDVLSAVVAGGNKYLDAITSAQSGGPKSYRIVLEQIADDKPKTETKAAPELKAKAEPESEEQPEDVAQTPEPQDEVSEPEASEDQNSPAPSENDDPAQMGQQARVADDGPDSNPFDGGTDEYNAWQEAYEKADGQVRGIIEAGASVAKDGGSRDDCEWRPGSDAERFWLQGFDSVEQGDDTAPEGHDSHKAGFAAAERGEGQEDNPYAEGSVKHRMWKEGFSAFWNQNS